MTDLGLLVLQLLADRLLPAQQTSKPATVQLQDAFRWERKAVEMNRITTSSPVANQQPAFSRSVSSQSRRQTQRKLGGQLQAASDSTNNFVNSAAQSENFLRRRTAFERHGVPSLPIVSVLIDQKPEFSQVLSREISENSRKLSKSGGVLAKAQLNRQHANSRQTSVQPLASRLQLSSRASSWLEAFSNFTGPRPSSGSQLYQQRLAALNSGQLYTRLSPDSFYERWVNTTHQPTYEQWRNLLAQEAKAMEYGQGANRLAVVLGDSLSLWLPPEWLSTDRFWLNQGISGDTTVGIWRRLSAFAQTRPDTIHLMAGINDLKNGATNAEVVGNLRQIMGQLHQTHPQAKIVVYSILPTRAVNIPSDRIRRLNQQIEQAAQQEGIDYFDLQPNFADSDGNLSPELTTDGIHLTPQGYRVWQLALLSA